jgi:hypothetical protein
MIKPDINVSFRRQQMLQSCQASLTINRAFIFLMSVFKKVRIFCLKFSKNWACWPETDSVGFQSWSSAADTRSLVVIPRITGNRPSKIKSAQIQCTFGVLLWNIKYVRTTKINGGNTCAITSWQTTRISCGVMAVKDKWRLWRTLLALLTGVRKHDCGHVGKKHFAGTFHSCKPRGSGAVSTQKINLQHVLATTEMHGSTVWRGARKIRTMMKAIAIPSKCFGVCKDIKLKMPKYALSSAQTKCQSRKNHLRQLPESQTCKRGEAATIKMWILYATCFWENKEAWPNQ